MTSWNDFMRACVACARGLIKKDDEKYGDRVPSNRHIVRLEWGMDRPPPSQEFAQAKQAFLEDVRAAFGWEKLDRVPPEYLEGMRGHWTEPYTTSIEKYERNPPTY